MSKFPCQAAVFDFLANLMNEIMMSLLRGVVSMLKDCNDSRLAITAYFDGTCGDVMKVGDGFGNNNECEDAAEFALVRINIVWVSWSHICTDDA